MAIKFTAKDQPKAAPVAAPKAAKSVDSEAATAAPKDAAPCRRRPVRFRGQSAGDQAQAQRLSSADNLAGQRIAGQVSVSL